jgi:hypothetical protein
MYLIHAPSLNPWETTAWADFPEDATAAVAPEVNFSFGFGAGSFYDPLVIDDSGAGPADWNDLTGSMRTGLTPAVQRPNPFEPPVSMTSTAVKLETVQEVQTVSVVEAGTSKSDKPDVIPCQVMW